MPVSEYFDGEGKKVLKDMQERYGKKKGKSIFYATAKKKDQEPEDKDEGEEKESAAACPGSKIRSGGKGRGLGIGQGKGPIGIPAGEESAAVIILRERLAKAGGKADPEEKSEDKDEGEEKEKSEEKEARTVDTGTKLHTTGQTHLLTDKAAEILQGFEDNSEGAMDEYIARVRKENEKEAAEGRPTASALERLNARLAVRS